MSSEVDSVINANSLPRGLSNYYFMVLPPNVGSCFGTTTSSGCFLQQWCAYHSYNNTGGTTVYANIPYAPVSAGGCGTGQYPNGHANGNVDDVLSGLSHEANEAREDPRLNAWFDANGNEGADKCRNTGNDYGTPLGGSPGSLFNELINSNPYYVQMDWGNGINGCEQRNALPTATFTAPGRGRPGRA